MQVAGREAGLLTGRPWPFLVLALLSACSGTIPVPLEPPAPPPQPAASAAAEPALEPPASAPTAEPPPTASPARSPLTAPERVRVGLATDLDEVVLPCCDAALVAEARGERVAVVAPLVVRPAAGRVAAASFRLQVAALKAERQAVDLAARLRRLTGLEADVVFDAGTDLYRVRLGRFATREEAETARVGLTQRNLHDVWIASEQPRMESPALAVSLGDRSRRIPGRWLEIGRAEGEGISVLGKRYRGRILVYLNDRGSLNLINELPFESYLRGVVPREMGPRIYDDLEALKAQAVAARTYALKNLGEFAAEGYDICATPRCQVYGGMDVEEELTDRAIEETASEVLVWNGQLVDAMYSSTCGGHTEDVRVVFPLKDEPYLKGVPCLEAGTERLSGDAPSGIEVETEIVRRLLGRDDRSLSAPVVSERLLTVARAAGLAAPEDRLASLERREVQRFAASIFDLALDARLFVADEDLEYLLANPPRDWSEEELRLAVYLWQAGLLGGDPGQPLGEEELDASLFHLAIHLRVLEQRTVRFMGLVPGAIRVRAEEELSEVTIPASLATFRRVGETATAGPLKLIAGDRLTLFSSRGRLLGIEQQVDPDGVGYDRTSNRSRWRRFRSDATLRKQVATRYPGFELANLEILSRGISGRVARLALVAADGRREEIEGLPIRWTLDLPDTLFTAKRLRPAEGESGWLFSGRGWGHGVGMCQVGAYGMALRGNRYDEILGHYYSGARLATIRVRGASLAAAAGVERGLW